MLCRILNVESSSIATTFKMAAMGSHCTIIKYIDVYGVFIINLNKLEQGPIYGKVVYDDSSLDHLCLFGLLLVFFCFE